jgi:lipoprotein-releasing system ATP-binding protein
MAEGAVSAPILEMRAVTKTIDGAVETTLVKDIDLTILPGDFLAVTGPSASWTCQPSATF